MGTKILTKTDQQMEDRMLAVQNDPMRADTLQKARAFKRTWLELAEALAKVQAQSAWEGWGFSDFDAYCRKELHLRGNTVQKLLGSYRFLETSAPRVIERAREDPFEAPIPSVKAVEFVQKATERAAADPETLETIQRVAFEEGVDAPILARRFKEIAFPESDRDRKDKVRTAIVDTARRLSKLIAEDDSPVPKKIAVALEESIGELLSAMDN
ncbi:MAG: hypothetical protein QM831_34855 [Kofleriaceae bacterium]